MSTTVGDFHIYFVLQTQDKTQSGKAGKLQVNALKSLIGRSESLASNKNLLPKFPNKLENWKIYLKFKTSVKE